MELFLLNKPEYHRLYNCSLYKVDDIPLKERAHPFWGTVFSVTAVMFTILYIPCVWAMCVSKLRRYSSYKLMIQLGVIQIVGLIFPGLYFGIQSILGVMFCSAPDFEYITGLLACNHWVISSVTCDILSFNRLCALYSPELSRIVFGGKRLLFWMLLPFVYDLFMIWHLPPVVFNAQMTALLANPHHSYIEDTTHTYLNGLVAFHNSLICCTEIVIFISMVLFYIRARHIGSEEFKSAMHYEKLIYVQVIFIGLLNFTASLMYDLMQLLPISFGTPFTGTYLWLWSQGIVSILYLSINQSIRRTILQKLGLCRNRILPDSRYLKHLSLTKQTKNQQTTKAVITINA